MPEPIEQTVAAPDRGEDYAGAQVMTPPSDDATDLNAASDAEMARLLGEDYSPTTPTEKPAAPAKLAEAATQSKPVEPAPAKPVASTEKTAPTKHPIEIAQEKLASKQPRNLDGFTPDEQKLLRKMPNETWAMVEPLLRKARETNTDVELPKKYKALEDQLNEIKHYRYADHPEAYRLDETYNTYSSVLQNVNVVDEHIRQQLASIRAGAKEIIMPVLDAQGNIAGTKNVAVLPTTADDLLQHRQLLLQDRQQLEGEIGKLKQTHADRWKSHTEKLNSIYAENFGKYEQVLKPLADKYLENFPAYFRNTTEAKLLAYSLASGKYIADAASSAQAASTVDSVREKTARSNGPTAEELHTGVAANPAAGAGNEPLSQEMFMAKYYR